jgi:hypothetical protein
MRKLFIVCVLLVISLQGQSQEIKMKDDSWKKNIVKINLLALSAKNISLQYERGLGKKTSVALGLRIMPKSTIPFKNAILNQMNKDNDTDKDARQFVNDSRFSNWAITPEFRYYFGKKPNNGFYVAPFIRIAGYSLDFAYDYKKESGSSEIYDLKGKTTVFSGGVLFGAQWHLKYNLVLDWWILGPSYGAYDIKLESTGDFSDLTETDRANIKEFFEAIKPMDHETKVEITSNRIAVTNNLPLPSLRTGFCIGYNF